MTINRTELTEGAFWAEHVCLDCETVQVEPDREDRVCRDCGSDAIYSCEFVLRCADAVEEEQT